MLYIPYFWILVLMSLFTTKDNLNLGFSNPTHEHYCGNDAFDFSSKESELLFVTEKERPNGDIDIYVESIAYCPMTFDIKFSELLNMETDVSLPHSIVIPPRKKQHKVLTISRSKNFKGGYLSFKYEYAYYVGDIDNAKPDENYLYHLPFQKGTSHLLGQGYNGQYSHRNMYCLDFNMAIGTKVCAARDGVVIRIKEDSNTGCTSPRCEGKANYIVIYHNDGTTARYVHLKHKGAIVNIGDKVKAGEVIGYSGNTGWSSGPHLHFEVDLNDRHFTQTLPTQFKTAQGILSNLEEGKTYY